MSVEHAKTLEFWQEFRTGPSAQAPYDDRFPVQVGKRMLDLPIRPLPDGTHAVASLLVNHASFDVLDAIVAEMTDAARAFAPDVIVGVPTLGLTLAPAIAHALGHDRYVPLSTSRKFWYDPALSVPISSITTPDQSKTLGLDPNLLPLLEGRRVVLVDDVTSSGISLAAAVSLMMRADITPVGAVCAMTQTRAWMDRVRVPVRAVFATPRFVRDGAGWRPMAETLPPVVSEGACCCPAP